VTPWSFGAFIGDSHPLIADWCTRHEARETDDEYLERLRQMEIERHEE
jgi:hypothetical protein